MGTESISKTEHYETAPSDRIHFHQKPTYGTRAFVNDTLAAAMGGMVIVLNLGLGMKQALVGLLGAIAVGIIFTLLWQLPVSKIEAFYFWWILGGSLIFYRAYTVFATPRVAPGYELTPDYHERAHRLGLSE